MNKAPQIIQQVKQIPIIDYLSSLGIMPAHKAGNQFFYCSPKTNEKTPSLAVNPYKNVYFDWSGESKGDIISLVQHLAGCTFLDAVNKLEPYLIEPPKNSFSFSGQLSTATNAGVALLDVKPLQHQALIQYVEKRGITRKVYSRYLREIHYQANNKKYFAVGFPNDAGGYEVRNQYFKGSFAPKTISTFQFANSGTLLLFEGFFDFLSALEYYGKTSFPATVIVLNSLSNLSKALPDIKRYSRVSTFFDLDKTGRKAQETIKSATTNVTDFSTLYAGFKDFNEMLCRRSILL
ncbi:CHC2 zinc finger domain-containing protein [Fibrivirga algicola]|uniref:Mobilization protein n=1 Tax=Fibrivirga algicola TaxID=2950420 RepID=A0ABX0QCG4_9BACT|nr:toprim domain-containing protein [Fibrivirga algicola]NID08931.1 mobilization protein [Fibrivirga algicola]